MLKGSCLCGSVQYEVHGELGLVVMCHCSKCRKSNGTAFGTNAPIEARAFELLSGADALGHFESSSGVVRTFCRNCGSPLYSRRAVMPDVLRLRIGTLDTKIEERPAAHIFAESKAEWLDIHDELPQFAAAPSKEFLATKQ